MQRSRTVNLATDGMQHAACFAGGAGSGRAEGTCRGGVSGGQEHASGPTGGIGGGTAGLEELAGVCECAAIRRGARCNALNMAM